MKTNSILLTAIALMMFFSVFPVTVLAQEPTLKVLDEREQDLKVSKKKWNVVKALRPEIKEKLNKLDTQRLRHLVKANISKENIRVLANNLSEEQLKRLTELKEERLRKIVTVLKEEPVLIKKVSDLEPHKIKQLVKLPRAEIKKIAASTVPVDIEKRVQLNEVFKKTALRKRVIPNIAKVKRDYELASSVLKTSNEEYNVVKDSYLRAKSAVQNCIASTEDCSQLKVELKLKTINFLLNAVNVLEKKLNALEKWLEANERYTEEEITSFTNTISELKQSVLNLRAEIELMDDSTPAAEVISVSKKVKHYWLSIQALYKQLIGRGLGRQVANIIANAENLEERLDDLIEKAAQKGIGTERLEELLEEFSAHVLDAKNHYEKAKALWKEIGAVASDTTFSIDEKAQKLRELVRNANNEIRAAHNSLKEAHRVLKETVKFLRKNTVELVDSNKPHYVPGNELGYFIWQNSLNDWLICMNSDQSPHIYNGTITVDSGYCKVQPRLGEHKTDHYKVSDNIIKFEGWVGPHQDCLQFRIASNKTSETAVDNISFELYIDNQLTDKVFVGKNKQTPSGNPFTLTGEPAKYCVKEVPQLVAPTHVCPETVAEVCGNDGVTYTNSCVARKAGVEVAYTGPCAPIVKPVEEGITEQPTVEACTDEYEPVCGSDGTTYSNSCWADSAGVEVVSQGVCPLKITATSVEEAIATTALK